MKTTTLRRKLLLLVAFVATFSMGLSAAEYCYWLYNSNTPANAADDVYFSWTTDTVGNIQIKIYPTPENTAASTSFRGVGWRDTDRFTELTVNGDKNGVFIEVDGKQVLQGYKYFIKTMSTDLKTITLTKMPDVDIPNGAAINIRQTLEYRTGTFTDLWPSPDFSYTYGSVCEEMAVEKLATPVITGINADKEVAFEAIPNAGKYTLTLYRQNSALVVHTQTNFTPGGVINYSVPGTYTVKVQAITTAIEYSHSDLSAAFPLTIEGVPEPPVIGFSKYCEAQLGGGANGVNAIALFTWTTLDNGNISVKISPFEGDTNTAFRAVMGAANITINGQAGTWFTSALASNNTEVIFTSLVPLFPGDKIVYNGIVPYRTLGNTNAFPTITFDYVYGAKCGGAPVVSTNVSTLLFTPEESKHSFTLSGENLTEAVVLKAPRGITVTPSTIEPDAEGKIVNAVIRVAWEGGSSGGGKIAVTGGGVAIPKEILLSSTGFSMYCNAVLSGTPAYISIDLSENRTQLIFNIYPYNEGETVHWNANSLGLTGSADVGGVATPYNKLQVTGKTNHGITRTPATGTSNSITITFEEPLEDGDVVSFGDPLVWTVVGVNTNAFINGFQYYTVGLGCDVPVTILEVTSASVVAFDKTTATVSVRATAGDYPVAKIRFVEDDGKVATVVMDKTKDNTYKLQGLTTGTAYSFTVTAIDTDEKESPAYSEKLAFTTQEDFFVTVRSVSDALVVTGTGAKTVVRVNDGDYPLDKIRFKEDGGVVDILLPGKEDNNYELTGLTPSTAYSFAVTAIDTEGNESPTFTTKLIFTTKVATILTIKSVGEAFNMTKVSANVVVEVNAGDYPLDKIKFKEDNGKVAEIVLTKQANNTYLLEGLTENIDYSFAVSAIDTQGNESPVYENKLQFKIEATGLTGPSYNLLALYPNPATDVINFTEKIKTVSIYSLQGVLVISQQNVDRINVSGLAKGIYIIQALDNADNRLSNKVEIK